MVRPHDGCLFGSSSITGNFKVNNPPTISFIPAQTAETGSEFKLKISASDKDQEDHRGPRSTINNQPSTRAGCGTGQSRITNHPEPSLF